MYCTYIITLIHQCRCNRFLMHAYMCHEHKVAAKMTTVTVLLYIPQRRWELYSFVKIPLNGSTDKRGKIHKYNSLLVISVQLLLDLKNNAENNCTEWHTVYSIKSALGLTCNKPSRCIDPMLAHVFN